MKKVIRLIFNNFVTISEQIKGVLKTVLKLLFMKIENPTLKAMVKYKNRPSILTIQVKYFG